MIYTTLTSNSTTLYTYENFLLIHKVNNLNCSEIVSQELGLINASKTLVGSMTVLTHPSVTQSSLVLYFMKKLMINLDGSNDLLTVIAIANANVNKILVLNILKKIMDKYISFKQEIEDNEQTSASASQSNANSSSSSTVSSNKAAKLGKFKPFMNQIIKFEELNYDSNAHAYRYGAPNGEYSPDEHEDEESSALLDADVINPNQLLLANEEIDEVRHLMLDNINKVMNRGDKINSLVDQTDRLNNSSSVFQKRAQIIKRKMWLSKSRFILTVVVITLLFLYIIIASECGFLLFNHCIHS